MKDAPQNLIELKQAAKGEVRGISRETRGKVFVKQGSEQSCVTQKAGFSSTYCNGGVVERGDARPVAKKSPKYVLRDDIIKICL